MKNKIIKTIIMIILITVSIALIVAGYYLIVDIESKMPQEIEKTCEIQQYEYMGRKIFTVTSKEQKTNKKILYFHGGSYVAEATKEHWDFIEKIVATTGATVIMPDYPLAPKYNYKDVYNMLEPLYKEIIKKVETQNLIIAGDSAGGGIALALQEKLSEEQIELPQKTILISPWLDVRLTNEKIGEVQELDKELSKEKLILAGRAYAGEDGIDSYLVNPIEGDLSKLKNIIIMTGTHDILNPDVDVLVERAKNVGINIEKREYKEAQHIWFINKKGSTELIEQGWSDFVLEIIKE